MTRTLKATWLPLSVAFAVAIAVVGLVGALSTASAAANSVTLGSATVAAGAQATVKLSIEAPAAKLGSWDIIVDYDNAKLSVADCVAAEVGTNLCNKAFDSNSVKIVGASASGASGARDLADITFNVTGLSAGQCSPLTVVVNTFTDPEGNPTSPTASNGQVCVEAAATPTPTTAPTPTPKPATPTPAPTATPAKPPTTGGAPTDGSGVSPVVLAVMGLAVVSAGAWAFSRTRRETL